MICRDNNANELQHEQDLHCMPALTTGLFDAEQLEVPSI